MIAHRTARPSDRTGRIIITAVASVMVWVWAPSAECAQAASDRLDAPAEARLASSFMRRAAEVAAIEPPSIPGFDLALELSALAVELQPDDPELVRSYLEIARLAERDALQQELIAELSARDPHDTVIRLQRVHAALNRYQTADALIAAYDKLLQPENARALGAAVASRLALERALLHRRRDEVSLFADWLATASALDQSNKAAAAMAVGFFQMQVDDPFGQAELLVNLLLADPTDVTAQTALAQHLLRHGAYEGAARMYRLAAETHTADRRAPSHDVLADLALAQWASGDVQAAKSTIFARERTLNDLVRMQVWSRNPKLKPLERAEIQAPVPHTLAAVKLAILERQGDARLEEELERFRHDMVEAVERAPEDVDDQLRADTLLALALLVSWFGNDADAIADLQKRVEAIAALTDEARQRFEGWIALRRGETERAVELFGGLDDPVARVGHALALIEGGETEQPASILRNVAQAETGSLISVWSAYRALALTATPVPAPEIAVRLNALIAGLPRTLDRLPSSPHQLITLRLEPLKRVHGPFEPVIVRVTLTNNMSIPLGISTTRSPLEGRDAPIQKALIIQPRLTIVDQPLLTTVEPIVIDLGRRLRLEPHEQVSLEFDLRRYGVGDYLDASAIIGASIELRATLNPVLRESRVLDTGVLGLTYRTPIFRVNGADITATWVEETGAELANVEHAPDVVKAALLAQAVVRWSKSTNLELRSALESALQSLTAAFPRLSEAEQAWLISVLPRHSDPLQPLMQTVRTVDRELVQIMYLLAHASGGDDPMLQAAQRSAKPRVKRIGDLIAAYIAHRVQIQRELERTQQLQTDNQ